MGGSVGQPSGPDIRTLGGHIGLKVRACPMAAEVCRDDGVALSMHRRISRKLRNGRAGLLSPAGIIEVLLGIRGSNPDGTPIEWVFSN